jgi:hypothetical protein
MSDDQNKSQEKQEEQKVTQDTHTPQAKEKPSEADVKTENSSESSETKSTQVKPEENAKPQEGETKKEENPNQSQESKTEEVKEEKKEEPKPQEPKEEKKSPQEKREETKIRKSTTVDTLKLVDEIKEVAQELREINQEINSNTNKEPDHVQENSSNNSSASNENKPHSQETKNNQTSETKVTTPENVAPSETDPKDGKQTNSEPAKEAQTESTKPVEPKEAKEDLPVAKNEESGNNTTTTPADTQSNKPQENKDSQGENMAQNDKTTADSKTENQEQTNQTPQESEVKVMSENNQKTKKPSIFTRIFAKKDKSETRDKEQSKPTKKSKKKLLFIIPLVMLLLIAGLGAYAYFSVMPIYAASQKTTQLAREVYATLKTQDLVASQAKLKETKESFQTMQQKTKSLAWVKLIPVVSKYYSDAQAGLNAGMAGIEAGEILFETIIPYADVLGFTGEGTFAGGTAEDRIVKMVETLDKVTPSLEKISEKIKVLNSQLDQIDPTDYPDEVKGKKVKENIIKAKLLSSEVTRAFTDARPLIEVLPNILGYPEGKKYLVLFQNDGELRPTGGFMSAFAILQVDKGKITAVKSDDIYGLDKKLAKKPKAPEVLKKYLNEDVWFLRNMNLSPDYKVSMATFEQYYKTLDGEYEVDGIIAIDTTVLERTLEIIGPIEIPGYGTFTTEEDKRCNLPQIVCELEHIVDKPLATLVTNRKRDILGPMMKTILDKATSGNKEQLAKLISLGFQLLDEKHVLTYFKDEKAQAGAEGFNIAGRINNIEGDYLHVNDANLGGAKSNFYIDQEVEQEIEIKDDGTVTKKVTIAYTHTEPMDNCNLEAGELCLSGIQRNYFRVYVPKGSKLVEGLGSETEITAGEDLDKTYFEGFFNLRPQSKGKIMLTYTLPFKVQKGGEYKILIQKQPGTKNIKETIRFNGSQTEEFVLNKDTQKTWKI